MTRIIAGAAGSLRLEVPKSGTRPTSDRVREAIFATLESWNLVQGSRMLDLYAGSGALGLEAVSRGAAAAVFVEKHSQAAQVAAKNAKTVQRALTAGTAPQIEVVRSSAQSYLSQAKHERFDVVMLDPPYELSEQHLAANLALLAGMLAPDGVVLVERSSRSPEPEWPGGLVRFKQKRYGETVLWWAEPAEQQ